jgi:hypothetical protein
MTTDTDPERELDATGWPVGMTREQILAAAGVTEEEARRCERLAALSETEFKALVAQRSEGQIGNSTKKPRGLAKATLALREAILETFEDTGKPVTVRQMFYLLSVGGAVEKEESGYRKAQRQLLALRRAGLVPYGWIADNTRWMRKPTTYAGLGDFFDRAATYYRQDLWVRSDVYVEVWCEKDALAGVLMPVTREYDVPLMVARGYSSETFAYNAAEAMRETGKPCYVYYAGDLDPSGWQMARSLEQKLAEFGAPVVFERLAVNPEQIQAWDLPTRPSKVSDTRCKAFFAEFGNGTESVELDAIHPDLLRSLVRDAIEQHIDHGGLETLRREEDAAREALQELAQAGFD